LHIVCFERAQRPHGADTGAGFDAREVPRSGSLRIGALLPEGPRAGTVVDLNRALAACLALRDVGAPEAEADARLPAEPLAFLRHFPSASIAAREALAFASDALQRSSFADLERARVFEDPDTARLRAPVPRPGKIVAVARNYAAHADERGAERPREPVLFLKPASSVIGPDDPIVLPAACEQVDYEGELAVVIGRTARNVAPDEALACVAGYTVANDVTARDFQNVRGQHFIGKSCDTFCPLGPALVTADTVSDPQDLGLSTRVSGETMQSARTKEMIFPIAEVIAFASRLMTLEPGDVLLTGTPAGVGAARQPPRWLRDSDVVEVEIETLGRLRNPVSAGNAG
jgi:2-keto-4-pentenoate hydratase/2-oxohepta-3-ene-1,7-dioic acid hydratase in catechol pathway